MKTKFFALSYDDGVVQDYRFVELLNRYGVKGTFHLNAGLYQPTKSQVFRNQTRLTLEEMVALYQTHEVAAHSFSHPDLTKLNEEDILLEITKDITQLDRDFQQFTTGFAYPFGTYNEVVIHQLKKTQLLFARTIESTHSFKLSDNLYRLQPTCHHADPNLMDLAHTFIESTSNEPQLFLVWGHSFELRDETQWNRFEEFLQLISGQDDIHYGTLSECIIHLTK